MWSPQDAEDYEYRISPQGETMALRLELDELVKRLARLDLGITSRHREE